MSFTTTFTFDAAGRLTRRYRENDSAPGEQYNQQDFTYNQRNQVTQITNTVSHLGTPDATRAFGYHGDGTMVTLSEDPMAPTSYLAWCAGGRLGYERNDDDVALYRWGPTGLVEFSPPDPEHRSRRSADDWDITTRLTGGFAQDKLWVNESGEVLASSLAIGMTPPHRNRIVNGDELIRMGLASADLDVGEGGNAVQPDCNALCADGAPAGGAQFIPFPKGNPQPPTPPTPIPSVPSPPQAEPKPLPIHPGTQAPKRPCGVAGTGACTTDDPKEHERHVCCCTFILMQQRDFPGEEGYADPYTRHRAPVLCRKSLEAVLVRRVAQEQIGPFPEHPSKQSCEERCKGRSHTFPQARAYLPRPADLYYRTPLVFEEKTVREPIGTAEQCQEKEDPPEVWQYFLMARYPNRRYKPLRIFHGPPGMREIAPGEREKLQKPW